MGHDARRLTGGAGAVALVGVLWASVSFGLLVARGGHEAVAAEPAARAPVDQRPNQSVAQTSSRVWWLDSSDARQFVGSPACERCHADAYRQWNEAFHLQMTREVADTQVLGDFSRGTRFEQHGRRYSMETRDGRYFMSIAHGDRPPERFEHMSI